MARMRSDIGQCYEQNVMAVDMTEQSRLQFPESTRQLAGDLVLAAVSIPFFVFGYVVGITYRGLRWIWAAVVAGFVAANS